MEIIQAEFYLNKILETRIEKKDLINLSPLIEQITDKLSISCFDFCQICNGFPDILKFNPFDVVYNLSQVEKFIDLSSKLLS